MMQFRIGKLIGLVGLAVAGCAGLAATAQDARTVTEPVIPPSCTVLTAQTAIVNGEPASETNLDTSRIQSAMAGCAAGQAVELAASGGNNAFLSGPLVIPAGVTLLVDGGVTLFGSRNPADYQVTTAGVETCGTVGTAGNGCQPLITASGANSAIMGYGVIDGRGQDKLIVGGNVASYSWWDQAGTAQNVSGSQNNPILIMANQANFVVYKITVRNSAMFHIKWTGNITTKTGFTAWGVKVITPFTARNSDGIDPAGGNISVLNSSLSDGDDDVAVSASSAVQNVTVANVTTYSGHGISVGSITKGGLTNMLVQNITQVGTAADKNAIGIRIKAQQSNGGLVQNVTYQNICSANNRVAIYLSPYYSTSAGTSYPSLQNITYRNIHVVTENSVTLQGYQNTAGTVVNPSTVNLDNVIVDGIQSKDFTPAPQHLRIVLGPGPVSAPFTTLTGTDISYTGSVTTPTVAPYPCDVTKFQYLVGELYGSTPSSTNLQSMTLNAPTSVTLNAMLQPAMSQVTYASISGQGTSVGMPAPTAPVQFMEGSTVVGTGTLGGNGTLATATIAGVKPGTHTYTAMYAGDTTYTVPLTFGSVTVNVVGVASTTTVAITGSTVYGGSTNLTATVSGSAGTPTGTVQFVDGSTNVGSPVALVGGVATLPANLGVGSHAISANYLGDTTYLTSTGAAVAPVVIGKAQSQAAVAASSAAMNPNGSTTLTVTVPLVGSGVTPGGTVTVQDGGTQVGTGTLSSGKASVVVTLATLGSHVLTVTYAGDANYLTSSATVTIAVVPQFALTVSPAAVSLGPNGIATPTVTVTPAGGFSGTVTLTCSSPASYVTCSIAPASVSVSGTTAATAQAIITVAPVVSAVSGENSSAAGKIWLAMLLPLGLLGLKGRRSAWGRGLLMLLLLGLAGEAMTGCSTSYASKTPPTGTQTVTITATGGTIAPTSQVVVTVTN